MLPRTLALNRWTTEKQCRKVVENLRQRRFTAVYCEDSSDAVDYILKVAENAETIGFGGSLSVADLNISSKLAEAGKNILNHGMSELTPEQRQDVMRKQLTCDLFLTGTNAITLDGIIVNIDGTGNRVAAMIYGPEKTIIVVGSNKIVDGGVEDAIWRIKEKSAPPNTMRLERETPCATTGFCEDCNSPQRICNVTTVLDYKPSSSDIHVLVVNEEMGL